MDTAYQYLSGPAQFNIGELNCTLHSKAYREELTFCWWETMFSITLSGVICGNPSTTGNQVVAIIAIMLMIFYSTSNIRTVMYLQMMLPFIHLGYFGIYETNCKASWFDNAMINDEGTINAHKVFVMSIGKLSHVHERVDIMIFDIHIEQVLSMKYLGTYINERLSRCVQRETLYPHVAGKIVVLSRISSFYRSNEFKLLYENAKKPIQMGTLSVHNHPIFA